MMAGELPMDGKSELRMNSFDVCGFEMKTVMERSWTLARPRVGLETCCPRTPIIAKHH